MFTDEAVSLTLAFHLWLLNIQADRILPHVELLGNLKAATTEQASSGRAGYSNIGLPIVGGSLKLLHLAMIAEMLWLLLL